MITINLSQDDLAGLRFAYGPLQEVTMSYRVLSNPTLHAPYAQWVEETRHALYEIDLSYLNALITPAYFVMPDFLTPTPTDKQQNIAHELENLMATPVELIRDHVQLLIGEAGNSEMRQYFVTHPREALLRLAEDIRLYWQRALAPQWSRVISALESDLVYRGRRLAVEGPAELLADLHPSISYQLTHINIKPLPTSLPGKVKQFGLNGQGLQLVPQYFSCGRSWQFAPEWRPMVGYRIRGIGSSSQDMPTALRSLELALGTGRARVLQALINPANTGEVARQLQISAGHGLSTSPSLNRGRAGSAQPQRETSVLLPDTARRTTACLV